jgi:hypothetical protein
VVYLIVKTLVSALLIAAISELSKRYTALGALLASLPLVSLLAMIWLWADTRDNAQVARLSQSIFWLVLPSLPLFLLLPLLLRKGLHFAAALPLAAFCSVLCYVGMAYILRRCGVCL